MNIKKILKFAVEKLKNAGVKSAVLDAEVLLLANLREYQREFTRIDKSFLYTHPEFDLNKKQEKLFKKYIARRVKHEPVAYILGEKEFYGLNFKVNKSVLIPRPETEILIKEVLKVIKNKLWQTGQAGSSQRHGANSWLNILEIGTGSGCISIALTKNLITNHQSLITNIIATDISNRALKIARENAKMNRVENKVEFIKSDLLSIKPGLKVFKPGLIVANLPYLPEKYKKEVESDIFYEPQSALWAGKDGLDLIKKLLKQIKQLPVLPKYIFLEINPNQKNELIKFLKKIDYNKFEFIKDLAGRDRVLKIVN